MNKLIFLFAIHLTTNFLQAQPFKAFSVTVEGKGQPVILIPGYSCSGNVWKETVLHLKDRYECHVLTLAGYAGVAPIDTPILKTVHDEIIRYTLEKRLNHPVLIGHSLGGFMSLWLSSTNPDLVGKIISVDGVPFVSALGDSSIDAAKMQADPRYNAAAVAAYFEQLPDSGYINNTAKAMLSQVSDSTRAREIAGWSYASDRKTLGYTFVEMSTTDLRHQIAAIKQPVLILGSVYMGSSDNSYRILNQQYRQLQNKTIHVATSKHFIMYDQPEWLYKEIDAFLK